MIYGKKIFDWNGIKDLDSKDDKIQAIIERGAEFMKEIAEEPTLVTGAKLSGPDAALIGQGNPIALVGTDTVKTPDRGYEVLFDEVDMRASSNDSFDILDVTGGVTFYQIKPGEEVKLSPIPKGALTSVKYLRLAGGLNILDDWLRFNKYYLIDELFEDTIRRWWDKKADIFYALLAALGAGIDQAFDTDDITTINNACATILANCKAAGLMVDENPNFVITANPSLKARLLKAMKTTFETQGVNKQIVFNVPTFVQTGKIANTTYYVSLAGFKNKRGEWEDLVARDAQRDETHLGAVHVWTGAYNGVIGLASQHRRCSLS